MNSWDPKRFTLTEEHVALLRRMIVNWQDDETGAPEIDPKRPYGNSNVALDVAEILFPFSVASGELNQEQEERMLARHRETETALQVVLAAGTFEPGEYVTSGDYKRDWHSSLAALEGKPPEEPSHAH